MTTHKRAPVTPAEIERIRRAYIAGDETIAAICRRFAVSHDTVNTLAHRHGWPLRGTSGPRPGAQKARVYRKAPRPKTEAQQRADRLAEEAARERNLYGAALVDVDYLRRRGFPIDRLGIHPGSEGVNFGNTVISFAQLREKADRERRLEAAAKPVEPAAPNRRRGRRAPLKTSKARPSTTTIRREVRR